jgi:hypothetical protein
MAQLSARLQRTDDGRNHGPIRAAAGPDRYPIDVERDPADIKTGSGPCVPAAITALNHANLLRLTI